MVHKAQRRRCLENDIHIHRHQSSLPNFRHSLGFYRDPLQLSLQLHDGIPSSPSAAAQTQLSRTAAMSRAVLAEIPFSSPLNPDGSQHNLAAVQPCPPPASTAFKHHHPSARGKGPGHPSAGVPGRDLLHPEETPLFPVSHTHTTHAPRQSQHGCRILTPDPSRASLLDCNRVRHRTV